MRWRFPKWRKAFLNFSSSWADFGEKDLSELLYGALPLLSDSGGFDVKANSDFPNLEAKTCKVQDGPRHLGEELGVRKDRLEV